MDGWMVWPAGITFSYLTSRKWRNRSLSLSLSPKKKKKADSSPSTFFSRPSDRMRFTFYVYLL